MSMTTEGLLTLIAPQTLEEDLVDFFLDSEHRQGFTSLHVRGHSSQHEGMSPIEQVTGRQQQVQFLILVDESQARDICARLEADFSRVDIRYWFMPSSFQGRIGARQASDSSPNGEL